MSSATAALLKWLWKHKHPGLFSADPTCLGPHAKLVEKGNHSFPPLVQLFCAGVNTNQRTLVCTNQVNRDPAEELGDRL